MKTIKTFVSLFSGCGGLDLGMEQAGLQPVAYVERDRDCIAGLRLRHPNVPIVTDVFSPDLLHLVRRLRPYCIIGGPPCQPHSIAGRKMGLKDPRAKTLLAFINVVLFGRPPCFLLENVPPLQHLSKLLCKRFEAGGYKVEWKVLDAVEYGVPQHRKRFIMIGRRDGQRIVWPSKVSGQPITLRQSIGDLEGHCGECRAFSPSRHAVMVRVPAGGWWKDLPEPLRSKAMGNAEQRWGTATFRRLGYDRPSPTLTTSPTQMRTTLCHPKETRPLSVLEYKRIQGFPDGYVILGSLTSKYRQLGNAVTVPLAKLLGEALLV